MRHKIKQRKISLYKYKEHATSRKWTNTHCHTLQRDLKRPAENSSNICMHYYGEWFYQIAPFSKRVYGILKLYSPSNPKKKKNYISFQKIHSGSLKNLLHNNPTSKSTLITKTLPKFTNSTHKFNHFSMRQDPLTPGVTTHGVNYTWCQWIMTLS